MFVQLITGVSTFLPTAMSLEIKGYNPKLKREIGPQYGYFPNASKTWMVVKKEKFEEAQAIFEGTGVNITQEGKGFDYGVDQITRWSTRKRMVCKMWEKPVYTDRIAGRAVLLN